MKAYYNPMNLAFELLEKWILKKWTSNREKRKKPTIIHWSNSIWTDQDLSSQKWILCQNNSWNLIINQWICVRNVNSQEMKTKSRKTEKAFYKLWYLASELIKVWVLISEPHVDQFRLE
jgi:hypothetical protein